MKRFLGILLPVCAALLLPGCARYYRVTDPTSGAVYYTTRVDDERGGAIVFRDERTNKKVTIQNSEVEPITRDQFDRSIGAVGK